MRTRAQTLPRAGVMAGAAAREGRDGVGRTGRLAGLSVMAWLLLAAPARAELTYLWTVSNSPSGISTSRMPFDSLQACLGALSSMRASTSGGHDRYCSVAGQVVRVEAVQEAQPAPAAVVPAPTGAPVPVPVAVPVPIPVPVLPAPVVKTAPVAPRPVQAVTPTPAPIPAPAPVLKAAPLPQAIPPASAPSPVTTPAPVLVAPAPQARPFAPAPVVTPAPVPMPVKPAPAQPALSVPPVAAQPRPVPPVAQPAVAPAVRQAAPARVEPPVRELPALLQVQPLTILDDEASDDADWEQAELPMQVSEQGHVPVSPGAGGGAAPVTTERQPVAADDDFDDDEPPAGQTSAPAPVREVLPGFSGGLGLPGGP